VTEDELNWRFQYHPPTSEETIDKHTYIREWCNKLARGIFWNVPEGREKSLAITKVEEAMFWANAAIARSKETV
jgi:hypothetical protein